ncbi:MAG: sugar ABC transporter permease [Pseudomonadota bacterium]
MRYLSRRRLFMALLGLPAVFYVIVIAVWPMAQGIWFSLFEYNLIRPHRTEFIGFANYVRLFDDPTAVRAILNTFFFTFVAVAIEFVLGLGIALLLWRDDAFNRLMLALILVPLSITPLAVGLIFNALLQAEFGLVGYALAQLNLTDPGGMFATAGGAMTALIVIDVWQWTPLMALILLAGLKALPGDVLEAASVDGATALQRLLHVVMPLLLPAIFLALILRTMDAFRVFDSVFVTTKGGPGDSTNVLMYFAVKEGLEFFNVGYASAISNLMLVCIGVFAVLFIMFIRRADQQANT